MFVKSIYHSITCFRPTAEATANWSWDTGQSSQELKQDVVDYVAGGRTQFLMNQF